MNTSLRSNVDQYFSKLIERSNVNNLVEQLSCVGKASVSKFKLLLSKLLISVDFNVC
jgi:hypothetical protein